MTWDVYALRAPRGARSVEQIPDGYTGPAIGEPDDVVAAVREVAPHLDTSDPRWLRLSGPDHQVEIALGKGIRVHDVTFYITGGAGAVPVVLDVCRSLGLTPFDTETGEVLTAGSRPPADAPPEEADDDDRPWWRRLLGR
ncbi:hypothetical protein [Cellulomonas aerilata]|uniref:Uncharacterized protein n=1 Tax=Cellulomonas aerilata TaxID=515326 RepID=A0A512DAH7_9CELL|nr:hypothetical protein [Cellulomonas aerilata]GEO33483.1 hypothetical protein CAE01nite_12080 [Cellulomonas aerilata]